jgi:hypothetical protein
MTPAPALRRPPAHPMLRRALAGLLSACGFALALLLFEPSLGVLVVPGAGLAAGLSGYASIKIAWWDGLSGRGLAVALVAAAVALPVLLFVL